jgi:hypothetical protein
MDFPVKFNSAFTTLSPTPTLITDKKSKKEIKYIRKNCIRVSNQNHKIQLRLKEFKLII